MGKEEAGEDQVTEKGTPEEAKMVRLKDTATESYKDFKVMLSYLPPKVRKAISETPMPRESIRNIAQSIGQIRSGVWSTLPMICSGERCPYGQRCPLWEEGVAPVSLDCPLEQYLVQTYLAEYMEALQVTEDHKIEMGQIGTMVMCDIIIQRARNWMAKRPDGHVDVHATGIDNKGNVVLSRDISVEIKVEEKFDRIRQRNLESLLATRESRAKYDIIEEDDPALAGAKIRARAQAIIERKTAEGEAKAGKLLEVASSLEAKAAAKKEFLDGVEVDA